MRKYGLEDMSDDQIYVAFAVAAEERAINSVLGNGKVIPVITSEQIAAYILHSFVE